MTVIKDAERNEPRFLRQFADVSGRRVLEIGCGDGRLTWRYAGAARSVAAIDIERDELRIAAIERPADLESRVALSVASSIHLPFRSEAFDLAILAWSF
jgi:ubiquinone/menaquinone biosynthesis C-methylase UbiE